VDHARRLRRGGADGDGPGAGFLGADGEVGLQAQQFVGLADQAVQAGLFQTQGFEELLLLLVVQDRDLRLDLGRDDD